MKLLLHLSTNHCRGIRFEFIELMSFQATMPEFLFVGYSDDESLQSVQVWKIDQKDFDN